MPWLSSLGDRNRKELSPETVLLQGVAPLPLWATGPPGPGGSTCLGPRPQGYEGARRESLAVVKAIRPRETTPDKSWSSRFGGLSWVQLTHTGKLFAKKAQRGNAGQMILGRPRHVKRMEEELLDIGTWNVRKPMSKRPTGRPKTLWKMTF